MIPIKCEFIVPLGKYSRFVWIEYWLEILQILCGQLVWSYRSENWIWDSQDTGYWLRLGLFFEYQHFNDNFSIYSEEFGEFWVQYWTLNRSAVNKFHRMGLQIGSEIIEGCCWIKAKCCRYYYFVCCFTMSEIVHFYFGNKKQPYLIDTYHKWK